MASKPLFTPDEVRRSGHLLDRLLRSWCIKKGITLHDFVVCYNAYAATCGMSSEHTAYSRNNLLTAIRSDGLTFKRFEMIMVHVFGYQIEDLTLDLVNSAGVKETHKLSDSVMLG